MNLNFAIEAIQTASDPVGSLSSNSVNQSNSSATNNNVTSNHNGKSNPSSGMNLLLDAVNQQHNLAQSAQNTMKIQPPLVSTTLSNAAINNINNQKYLCEIVKINEWVFC